MVLHKAQGVFESRTQDTQTLGSPPLGVILSSVKRYWRISSREGTLTLKKGTGDHRRCMVRPLEGSSRSMSGNVRTPPSNNVDAF